MGQAERRRRNATLGAMAAVTGVWCGGEAATGSPPVSGEPAGPALVRLVDLDGDGDPEHIRLFPAAQSGHIVIDWSDGYRSVLESPDASAVWFGDAVSIAADLNDDGRREVVVRAILEVSFDDAAEPIDRDIAWTFDARGGFVITATIDAVWDSSPWSVLHGDRDGNDLIDIHDVAAALTGDRIDPAEVHRLLRDYGRTAGVAAIAFSGGLPLECTPPCFLAPCPHCIEGICCLTASGEACGICLGGKSGGGSGGVPIPPDGGIGVQPQPPIERPEPPFGPEFPCCGIVAPGEGGADASRNAMDAVIGDVVCLDTTDACNCTAIWVVQGPGCLVSGPDGTECQGAISFNDEICVLLTGCGDVTVHLLSECRCDDSSELLIRVHGVDLDIDSQNRHALSAPSRTGLEDEAEESSPKLIVTTSADRDDDGIPGWADGYGTYGADSDSTPDGLTPLVLEVPAQMIDSWQVRFQYDASDPRLLPAVEPTTWLDQVPPAGQFRLWTRDATFEPRTAESLGARVPGDYIEPDVWYDLSLLVRQTGGGSEGTFTLWVEAVNASATGAGSVIEVESRRIEDAREGEGEDDAPAIDDCRSDKVRVVAVEVAAYDARGWGLVESNVPPGIGLFEQDLYADMPFARVGGAITDGASVCVIRVEPPLDFEGLFGWDLQLAITRAGDPDVDHPATVGTLHQLGTSASSVLPPVPTDWESVKDGNAAAPRCSLPAGVAYYVPPESFMDRPNDPEEFIYGGLAPDGNGVEHVAMEFNLIAPDRSAGDGPPSRVVIGAGAFRLRRPPVVLVHGLLGSAAGSWTPTLWSDAPTSPFRTRIYAADYAATNTLGCTENFGVVALAIEHALVAYRTGNDGAPGAHHPVRTFHGLRYAATRADVIAHSLGGLITRFYIAGGLPEPTIDRTGWQSDALTSRTDGHPSGRWNYLRTNNLQAGSIRRFVPIGAPFQGSPLANAFEPMFVDGDNSVPMHASHALMLDVSGPLRSLPGFPGQFFQAALPLGPNGLPVYAAPTAVADLCGPFSTFGIGRPLGSDVRIALRVGSFPREGSCRWSPIVGRVSAIQISARNLPVGLRVGLKLLSRAASIVSLDLAPAISELSTARSDLVVPDWSQANLSRTASLIEVNARGTEIFGLVHSDVPSGVVESELRSGRVASEVASLLSGGHVTMYGMQELNP